MPTYFGMYRYDNSGTIRREKLEAKRKAKWEAMKAAARNKRTPTRGPQP